MGRGVDDFGLTHNYGRLTNSFRLAKHTALPAIGFRVVRGFVYDGDDCSLECCGGCELS